jgi:hypothetical protein
MQLYITGMILNSIIPAGNMLIPVNSNNIKEYWHYIRYTVSYRSTLY